MRKRKRFVLMTKGFRPEQDERDLGWEGSGHKQRGHGCRVAGLGEPGSTGPWSPGPWSPGESCPEERPLCFSGSSAEPLAQPPTGTELGPESEEASTNLQKPNASVFNKCSSFLLTTLDRLD